MKRLLYFVLILFISACQQTKVHNILTPDKQTLLSKAEVPQNKPLIAQLIAQNAQTSFHYITIKTQETPHIHVNQDLFVYAIKGSSWIYLNHKKTEVRPGDFIIIPKGVVHYAVNIGKEPAEVLAIFSPPFDAKDIRLASPLPESK